MNVSSLAGKTLKSVKDVGDRLRFVTTEGKVFEMYHEQDCCEQVYIESIVGDLDDLVGTPILVAEEVCNDGGEEMDESVTTWTFYKFATVKGWVDIRWCGTSNGYYSTAVSFKQITH